MNPQLYSPPHPSAPSAGFEKRLAATQDLLREASAFQDCALATSLSIEDMVLLHLLRTNDLPVYVFMLDTGKLHAETLALASQAEAHFGRAIARVRPEAGAINRFEAAYPESALYDSVATRKACCELRKSAPLRAALAGRGAWITGLRRAQHDGRATLAANAWDTTYGLHKFNPLLEWTDADLWHFARSVTLPLNALYAQGYSSIGCAPCTRPIRDYEHPRAGRWWWEDQGNKECGIHVRAVPTTHQGESA